MHVFAPKSKLPPFPWKKKKAAEVKPADKETKSRTPYRQTAYTSRYYFTRTVKIWNVLLPSLPVDLFILLVPPAPAEMAEVGDGLRLLIYLIGATVCLGLLRGTILSFLYSGVIRRISPTQTWLRLLAGVLIIGVFFEVATRLGVTTPALIIAAIVTLGATRAIREMLSHASKHTQRLETDMTFWVEQSNKAVFLVNIAPLIAARLLSLIGITHSLLFAQSYPPQRRISRPRLERC